MTGFPSPFGGTDDESDGVFDAYDEFVPAHLPEPGPFLDGHEVLEGDAHLAFHRLTRDLFEERGVYDMTFGYNLARLDLDGRHPDAGYRYAEESSTVLRAEFTPTTPFCPQSNTLTKGSFRAWNGLVDRHEYDLVRVRVHPMHHESEATNEQLAWLAERFRETGSVTHVPPDVDGSPERGGRASRGDAPF
ncbi:hypothetical protein [Salinirarus marinus]|uniref:hypothetical protein n=1 Tax=Salinirarus marinus TaxID=3068310 RepID=UPI003C6C8A77